MPNRSENSKTKVKREKTKQTDIRRQAAFTHCTAAAARLKKIRTAVHACEWPIIVVIDFNKCRSFNSFSFHCIALHSFQFQLRLGHSCNGFFYKLALMRLTQQLASIHYILFQFELIIIIITIMLRSVFNVAVSSILI